MKYLAALALLAAAPAWSAPSDPTRYAACIELAGKDPARAMQMAYAWRIEGGGVAPRHCLAVAQMHARHHEAALKNYEAAGEASEAARDGQAIALWRQAADAAMIAEQPADAVRFLTRALARPGGTELSPRAEADLLTTRAEAHVAAGKPDLAMADLIRATTLSPEYFTPWLLKATLARRGGDLVTAEAALLKAAALAPDSRRCRTGSRQYRFGQGRHGAGPSGLGGGGHRRARCAGGASSGRRAWSHERRPA